MHVSDGELLCELLQENGCSDVSASECSSDSEINVKISSYCEQSVNSDEEENVSDNSSIQHGIWTKSRPGKTHFPFTGKPGLNIDIGDTSNPLVYFELSYTPEITELIARETNQFTQKLLEI
jgi:hypothetical protein